MIPWFVRFVKHHARIHRRATASSFISMVTVERRSDSFRHHPAFRVRSLA